MKWRALQSTPKVKNYHVWAGKVRKLPYLNEALKQLREEKSGQNMGW